MGAAVVPRLVHPTSACTSSTTLVSDSRVMRPDFACTTRGCLAPDQIPRHRHVLRQHLRFRDLAQALAVQLQAMHAMHPIIRPSSASSGAKLGESRAQKRRRSKVPAPVRSGYRESISPCFRRPGASIGPTMQMLAAALFLVFNRQPHAWVWIEMNSQFKGSNTSPSSASITQPHPLLPVTQGGVARRKPSTQPKRMARAARKARPLSPRRIHQFLDAPTLLIKPLAS